MAFNIGERLSEYIEPMYILFPAFYGSCRLDNVKGWLLTVVGLLVILLEILTLQKRPRDILSSSKLSDRVFSKWWLVVGKERYGIAAETGSLHSCWSCDSDSRI